MRGNGPTIAWFKDPVGNILSVSLKAVAVVTCLVSPFTAPTLKRAAKLQG